MGEGVLLEEQNHGDDDLSPPEGDSQQMESQRASSESDWSAGTHPLENSRRARGVGRDEADGGAVRDAEPLAGGLAGRHLRPAGDAGRRGVPSAEGDGGGHREEGVSKAH